MHCPHCNIPLASRPDLAGQTFACSNCGGPFTVPGPIVMQQHYAPPMVASHGNPCADVHTVRQPHSTVTVNVPKQHSNSLGWCSIILAILGLFFCWMPLFGLPFAALGLVFGLGGLIVSMMRSGAGAALSLCGMIVAGVVLFVAGSFWFAVGKAVVETAERGEQIREERERGRTRPAAIDPEPTAPSPFDKTEISPIPSKAFTAGQSEARTAMEPIVNEPASEPLSPVVKPKAWQGIHDWYLRDGRKFTGVIKSWSPSKVVFLDSEGNEITTTPSNLRPLDREWVDARIGR